MASPYGREFERFLSVVEDKVLAGGIASLDDTERQIWALDQTLSRHMANLKDVVGGAVRDSLTDQALARNLEEAQAKRSLKHRAQENAAPVAGGFGLATAL